MVRDVVISRFRIARGVSNRQSYLTKQRQVAGETRECQPFICTWKAEGHLLYLRDRRYDAEYY